MRSVSKDALSSVSNSIRNILNLPGVIFPVIDICYISILRPGFRDTEPYLFLSIITNSIRAIIEVRINTLGKLTPDLIFSNRLDTVAIITNNVSIRNEEMGAFDLDNSIARKQAGRSGKVATTPDKLIIGGI